jgi:hypothetical protein
VGWGGAGVDGGAGGFTGGGGSWARRARARGRAPLRPPPPRPCVVAPWAPLPLDPLPAAPGPPTDLAEYVAAGVLVEAAVDDDGALHHKVDQAGAQEPADEQALLRHQVLVVAWGRGRRGGEGGAGGGVGLRG